MLCKYIAVLARSLRLILNKLFRRMLTMARNRNSSISVTLDEHPDLRLTLEKAGSKGTVIIGLAGMIDTYNADFFRNQAMKVVDAGYRHIIFDTTATTFMSTTGIGAFTALLKKIRQKEGSMIIFGMPSKIFEVFQLFGFSSFFQFAGTREEAISMVGVDSKPVTAFPSQFSCPVCKRILKVVKPGRFRCSSCRVILVINRKGEVLPG
jgi:anti-sigma B factor antagonist